MIYFTRHSESVANRDGYFAGKIDSPLTDAGERQAAERGIEILERKIQVARIITAPLIRAYRSGVIIANTIGYDPDAIEIDKRLDEYDFGQLTGKQKKGVDSEQFMATPDREDPSVFYERIREGWNEHCAKHGDSLIVSHSFVRLVIDCALVGGDINRFHDNASLNDPACIISYQPTPI